MVFELAALLPDHPGLGQTLLYQSVGLTVVIAALATLWLVVKIIGVGFKYLAPAEPAAAPAAAAGHGAAPTPDLAAAHHPQLDPETVAAMTAAIHFVMGAQWRIVDIREVYHGDSGESARMLAWSVEGRRQIFSSHRVR